MLKEQFLGRYPSHFKINPIVKAYIISESFLWAAWNFITPISAIFVLNNVSGGSVQAAATAFSCYQIARVAFELFSGRYLADSTDKKKIYVTVLGMAFLTASYLGLAVTSDVTHLYIFYMLSGVGLGIASPAKNCLFAMHLDKNKEAVEWGLADAIAFVCNALAAILGGYIATFYGFPFLFVLCAIVNILGVIPYIKFIR